MKKNVIGQLIFVDYFAEYEEVINTLVEEHDIKFVFTGCLGALSDMMLYYEFEQICKKYDSGAISEIGFLDYGLYKTVHKKRRNTKYVLFDLNNKCSVDNEAESNNKTIGILNSDDSNYDSYFNELCSFAFLPEYNAKIMNPTNITASFLKEYKINSTVVNSWDALIHKNSCNLYINFSGTVVTTFIASMDIGVPCIIGNGSFLDDFPVLKKFLVMKSDDDINEIAERVRSVIDNRKTIMDEYKSFRTKYASEVKERTAEFFGYKFPERSDIESEKLLTVVVPVYNTEKYLAKCIDSVMGAAIPGMEILIINDGSTDKSEEIAVEYQKQNPDLIRYVKQKNGGLGSVRNVGLKEAKGKYLASVDSDDTIQPEFFRDALPYMTDDVDMIMCDWMSISDDNSFETAALDWVFNQRKVYEGLLYTTIMPSTCNKIMKRDLFLNNRIRYLEQKYEDLSANPVALLKAKTIKYFHKPYYNYYLRNNSLMRSKIDPRQMTDVLAYLDSKLAFSNESVNVDEFKYYTYSWRIEEYIINPLYDLKGRELEKVVDYIYDKLYSIGKDIFQSNYYLEMLKRLKSEDIRDYIKKRNEAFVSKKLSEFIVETDVPQRISAGIIYYGD